jgi:hypothetical protein
LLSKSLAALVESPVGFPPFYPLPGCPAPPLPAGPPLTPGPSLLPGPPLLPPGPPLPPGPSFPALLLKYIMNLSLLFGWVNPLVY